MAYVYGTKIALERPTKQLSRVLPAGMVMHMQHFVLSQCAYVGTHSLFEDSPSLL